MNAVADKIRAAIKARDEARDRLALAQNDFNKADGYLQTILNGITERVVPEPVNADSPPDSLPLPLPVTGSPKARVLAYVVNQGGEEITPKMASDVTGVKPPYTRMILGNLAKEGKIERVRDGHYRATAIRPQ